MGGLCDEGGKLFPEHTGQSDGMGVVKRLFGGSGKEEELEGIP